MIPAGLYKRRTPPQGAVSLPPPGSLPLWGSLRDAQTCLPPAKRGGGVAAGGIVTEQRNNPSGAARMFFGFAREIVGVQPTKKNSARRCASRTAHPLHRGAESPRTPPQGAVFLPPHWMRRHLIRRDKLATFPRRGRRRSGTRKTPATLAGAPPLRKKASRGKPFFHISILLRFCRFQTDPCRSFRSARCRFPRR